VCVWVWVCIATGTAPKFTRNLNSVTAVDGSEVQLSCVVVGQPMPEVLWYHNDASLDNSKDFIINYNLQTGLAQLVIVDCMVNYTNYKCPWLSMPIYVRYISYFLHTKGSFYEATYVILRLKIFLKSQNSSQNCVPWNILALKQDTNYYKFRKKLKSDIWGVFHKENLGKNLS